jgi:hypothetical protein
VREDQYSPPKLKVGIRAEFMMSSVYTNTSTVGVFKTGAFSKKKFVFPWSEMDAIQ